MLEAFSAAYYLGRVRVEPSDADRAVVERGQHREAVATVYTTGVGIERLDLPLLVKLDGHHVPVFGADEVPRGTLALPPAVLDACAIDDPPAVRDVLVARADRAAQLLDWFTPYTLADGAVA